MTKPLLTAIIFTYNHKRYIARCIESHLSQKTTYDYEIRIYDDCSTDGTSDICRKYAEKYPDKIKLTVQKENTFTKPDLQLQSYQAICEIDTKYFCICDGDDYWCDENKVQIALDFLENHPEYHGFAHDTYSENLYTKVRKSYIHEESKYDDIQNPVALDARAPFFLVSSRVFRTTDYVDLKILPIDYLQYYYHLSKGSIYYYDKPMAVYTHGLNNTYAGLPVKFIIDNSAMMVYRLSKLFKFKQDDFCTALLLIYETKHCKTIARYNLLCGLKRIFGIRFGWQIWFLLNFGLKYGLKAGNVNYIYNRKKVKKLASPKYRLEKAKKEIGYKKREIAKKYRDYKLINCVLKNESKLPKEIVLYLKKSKERKKIRIREFNNYRRKMRQFIERYL